MIMIILAIIENILFMSILVILAWYGRDSPKWAFTFLFLFLCYGTIRIILSKDGMDRGVLWYSLNMLLLSSLLLFFLLK